MDVMWSELDGGRLLSPSLWKGFAPPVGGVFPGTQSGNPVLGLFDDFNGWGQTAALSTSTTYFQSNGITYLGYNDTTVVPTAPAVPTTTPAVDENGPGVISLQADTTDNDLAAIMAGCGTMVPFHVIPSRMQELVFECRFKISSIHETATSGETNLFLGLAGTGACANSGVWVDDSASMASNDFLGFTRMGAMSSTLDFKYQRVSGTESQKDDVCTMVADTWTKVGFRYHASRKQCSIWVDGTEVTSARVSSTITGATPWPSLYMNFLAAVQYQATTSHVLYLDWWACAQHQ